MNVTGLLCQIKIKNTDSIVSGAIIMLSIGVLFLVVSIVTVMTLLIERKRFLRKYENRRVPTATPYINETYDTTDRQTSNIDDSNETYSELNFSPKQ